MEVVEINGNHIGDDGIRFIADALDGNTTMEFLNIQSNGITSTGLPHVARLLESSRLVTIYLCGNSYIFSDDNMTRNFALVLRTARFLKTLYARYLSPPGSTAASIIQALETNTVLEHLSLCGNINYEGLDQLIESLPRMKIIKTLSLVVGQNWFLRLGAGFIPALRQNTTLEEWFGFVSNPDRPQTQEYRAATEEVKNIMIRNRSLSHAKSILQPHPETGAIVRLTSGLWQKAIVKLAQAPSHSGASAIFHILEKRPGLLEPRLRRQIAAAAAACQHAGRGKEPEKHNTRDVARKRTG